MWMRTETSRPFSSDRSDWPFQLTTRDSSSPTITSASLGPKPGNGSTGFGGVTGGLATAFDTTLVGLLATILLHFLTNFLKFRESLFLDQCNDYCQVHVLAKLKLSKNAGNDE